jgi:hypothetical protein
MRLTTVAIIAAVLILSTSAFAATKLDLLYVTISSEDVCDLSINDFTRRYIRKEIYELVKESGKLDGFSENDIVDTMITFNKAQIKSSYAAMSQKQRKQHCSVAKAILNELQ